MKPVILVSAPYAMPVIDNYHAQLEAAGCTLKVPPVKERLEEIELLDLVGDVSGIICGDDRITERVLDAAPALKVISKWGTGIDSIDTEAAAARGIQVLNTPEAFSECVADTVLSSMLTFARRPGEQTALMRSGRWEKLPCYTLGEKILGIVGFGSCGRAVAKRALGFGMKILANDILEIAPPEGVRMTDLNTLLSESDFVTLHTDLNPTSEHLINETTLSKMKSDAILINAARGPIVDETALIAALESGRLGGAALDVYEHEPLSNESPLRKLDNILLAPHNANSSPRAHAHVHNNTISNLLNALGLK